VSHDALSPVTGVAGAKAVGIADVSVRSGQSTAIAVERLDPDDVLSESALTILGTVSGRLPDDFQLILEQHPRGRSALRFSLPPPERGRFETAITLRNGANDFAVRITRPDGTVADECRFTVHYKSSFREWNETVFIAFLLALMIRSLVLQAFWIPTGSMEPTLLGEKRDPVTNELTRAGDRILVNRFAYVADLSLDGRIPFGPRYWFAFPKRGDIVVFKYPDKNPNAAPRDFIKRVIGLPGDHIRIIEGIVSVNGVPLNEPYIAEPPWQDFETRVPTDSLFVMGDNRNNSADSRYWGPMPLKNLKGQAVLLYWPAGRFRAIRSYPHPVYPHPERLPSSAGSSGSGQEG